MGSLALASARITPEKTISAQDYQWQLSVTHCQDTHRKTITITSNFLGLSVATVTGVCVVSCQIGKDRHTFTGKWMKQENGPLVPDCSPLSATISHCCHSHRRPNRRTLPCYK